jgi:hypothetical protein
MSDAPDRPDPLLSGRIRTLQYLSDAFILFASAVFALFVGTGWAWGPFLVSLLVVGFTVGCNEAVFRAGMRILNATEEQSRLARARHRKRNVVTVPGYLTMAVATGVVAGSLERYWPAVVVGVVFLLTAVVFPLAMLPTVKRRAEARRN